MLPDFSNIDYLREGSAIQQKGWEILTSSGILMALSPFKPILTGTLPLDIFIENKSDLDISCEVFHSPIFIHFAQDNLTKFNFSLKQKELRSIPSVIINFRLKDFEVEIVGQPLPIREQTAVRHLRIEYALLQHGGESLKNQVLNLKAKGIKTEPAFASLLQLEGDPYEALLKLEGNEHHRIKYIN
ncbi:MAG TPA: DUF4269 domain-containing protein [Ohtaekwangia sp.]